MGLLDPPALTIARAESPRTGIGLLAKVEMATTLTTTVSTAAIGDPFCILRVKPSEHDIEVRWEQRIGIAVAPGGTYGGVLSGIVWEMTMSGASPVTAEIDRDPHRVEKDAIIGNNSLKAKGSFFIPPSATQRIFALGAGLTKDNALSGLAGQLLHGAITGSRSQMAAYAL